MSIEENLAKLVAAQERTAVALEGLLATASGAVVPAAAPAAPAAPATETPAEEPPKTRTRRAAKATTTKKTEDTPAADVPSADELKARCATMSAEGHGDTIREMVAKCGAPKVSGLTDAGRAKLAKMLDGLAGGGDEEEEEEEEEKDDF